MPDKTIDAFGSELQRVVDYFRREYNLSYAAAIGTLECIKHDLLVEGSSQEQEKEPV